MSMSNIVPVALCAFSLGVLAAACGDETSSAGQNSQNGDANNWVNAEPNAANSGGGQVAEPDCTGNTCTCPNSLVICDDLCVDLSVNTNHCGECGEGCGSGAAQCVAGQCQCAEGAVQCDGECADLSSDNNHCGECENECGDNEQCVSGQCEGLMCEGGEVACEGECIDLSSDPENCGECESACFGGESCVSGQCVCEGGACAAVGNDGRVVGGSCSDANPCDDGSECLAEGDFPGGTCTTSCQATSDCPDGTQCVQIDGESTCLLACDGDRRCRDGYECGEEDNVTGQEVEVCIGE